MSPHHPQAPPDSPDLPDYSGACVCNILPAIFGAFDDWPNWLPHMLDHAPQVVLLVIDGMGWNQLHDRFAMTPNLAMMDRRWVHTVAPSTTASALTSITTGVPPATHGVIGYRMAVGGDVLNVLRWNTSDGDARRSISPESMQPIEPFLYQYPPVVTRSEFATSGFTRAHLRSSRPSGYRVPSTLVVETARLLRDGESFVYAYYEGLDKVGHEYGFGPHYDAELVAVDRLVGDLIDALPRGAVLLVTADHGQVHVAMPAIPLDSAIFSVLASQSGEGRFRWLHARTGRADALLEKALVHSDVAWVVSREQVVDEQWFGPNMPADVERRLGDVALVARHDVSFDDPRDTGAFPLIGRHGSLTPDEMRVPLLAYAAETK